MGLMEPAVEVAGDDLTDIEYVASGGTGVVYRAVQQSLGRVVALKVLHGVDLREDRIRQEAWIQAQVSEHANVVTLYGTTTVTGLRTALILEFVPGGSLSERIGRAGPLEAAEWLRLARELSSALAAAHGVGIIHRDVKPANVLFAADGSTRLADFGISGGCTRTVPHLETSVAFAAPELLGGDRPDRSNDVFSLALTVLVAALGRHPFGDRLPVAAMAARIQGERLRFTDWIPSVPKGLGALLDGCLDPEPEERPTVAELLNGLPAVITDADRHLVSLGRPSSALEVGSITVTDDRFGFGWKLLESVQFSVAGGGVLALVGRKESGVRLALEVIGGLRQPSSGSVVVGGVTIEPRRSSGVRLAYVACEPQFFTSLSVRRNLIHFAGLTGSNRAAVADRVESILDAMWLRDRANTRASSLSPAGAQRLHLAIAMASDPTVVLIDRIDTPRDDAAVSELASAVAIMAQRRIAVVVGTDDPQLASRLADRFCVLSAGRVVACGGPDAVVPEDGTEEIVVTLDSSGRAPLLGLGLEVVGIEPLADSRTRVTFLPGPGDTIEAVVASLPESIRSTLTSVEVRNRCLTDHLSRLLGDSPTGSTSARSESLLRC
ncbi:MAG: ATP-binding cassette domain-containing protein [Actinobacteria bacterium]|nr:ATP-binding cassette domain-containing protein [Actinomycetota bacterium]